jgi:beta-galactosidase
LAVVGDIFHWHPVPLSLKSNQTKSNQIKPNQTKSNQIKPNQTKKSKAWSSISPSATFHAPPQPRRLHLDASRHSPRKVTLPFRSTDAPGGRWSLKVGASLDVGTGSFYPDLRADRYFPHHIFMRSLTTLFLTLVIAGRLYARESTLLNSDWRFQQGDPAGVSGQAMSPADPNWIDSNWSPVTLPHCWGIEAAMAGKNYYRGPGWYRRDLNLGAPAADKHYFLRFDAASTVSDVYLNGQLLGEHRGGFGAFCYEITTNMSANGTNLLAVRVSNAPAPDVAPLSGDFSVYGGLYRSVHLLVTGNDHFGLTDHGSFGVAWLQTSVTNTQALLDVTAQICNATKRTDHLDVVARLLDADGNEVAQAEHTNFIAAHNVTAPDFLRVTVPNPHLWNGRKDPYLYQAVVELRRGDEVVDAVTNSLGLRYYWVDPDKGFFLNGQPYHLHGVDKHQDRMGKGWAVSAADLEEDVSLIKELGATVVRCAHYQHPDYFYTLCDRAGILVWAEIPQVDRVNDTVAFENTSRGQLLDLIRQNVNHPSIFVWSLFNEIRAGTPDPHRLLQNLKAVARGEDPTRPIIAATCTEDLPQMNRIPDLLGWNIYPGWYAGWGSKEDFSPTLEKDRYTSRSGGFCVSEYGAGANITQHEDDPKQPKTTSQWHPEEWQAIVHEVAWAQLKARPYVWGTFAWCMFDFAVASRHEGGIPGRNDKGLVTYDRKTKKDAFYFYKTQWSDEPVLYITSRRFTGRTNAVTHVKIYSNCATVDALVNGVSLGQKSASGVTNGIFVWNNVSLKPGENQVEARASHAGTNMTDQCSWNLKIAGAP